MAETVKNVHQILPQLIDKVIGSMGRFQYVVVFMLCFNNAITAISNVVTTFYSYQPDFHCGNLNKNQCNSNGTCSEGYVFNNEDHTIVSEWSLVCSRSLVAPTISTFYFVGLTIGAFVGGILADRFGRKPTLLFCLYAQGIIGLLLILVRDVNWFTGLRVLQGIFVQGMQTVIYILLMEYCSPSKRTMAGLVNQLMWAIGLIFLGGMAYVVRDWRDLQLFLAIPTIITILWTWLIPESMLWLYANHREVTAFKVCVRTAKYNKNYGSIESDYLHWKESIRNDRLWSIETISQQATTSFLTNLQDIFRTNCLRKHILITASTWFIVVIAYYGILLFTPTLTGDRYLNFILGSVIEFFVELTMYFVLAKFGRRKPLMLYLLVNGFVLILIGICNSYQASELLQIIIALAARGTSSSIFYGTFVYTNELFPTINRGCAFGICGLIGGFGSLLSPFILPLVGNFASHTNEAQTISPMLPMTILGILSILVGMGQYFLPETLNIQMPNSIEDAKRIWE